jgi:hypothetical protein
MDAKLSTPSVGRRRRRGIGGWSRMALGLLFIAGALMQACSDNNGTTGPTFACHQAAVGERSTKSGSVRLAESCAATPAPVVGDGTGGTSGGIFVQVAVSPGTVDRGRRASVRVIATSRNGFKLTGPREVFLTTTVGSLDATSGTLVNGVFETTLFIPCEVLDGAGNVIATVEGASSAASGGAFTAVTATSNNPCP